MIADIVKIFVPAVASFGVGILITPIITHFLYSKQMWKKKAGKVDMSGNDTPIRNAIHKDKDVNTPRMGGTIIWISVFAVISIVWIIAEFTGWGVFQKLDIMSRNQTWIPLSTLILGAVVGLFDDYLEIKGTGNHVAGGLSLKIRLSIVGLVGLAVGWWFYEKLGVSGIGLPLGGELPLGSLFVPFTALFMMLIYSGGIIDGIDGLSGGIFSTIFAAYAGIAFYQGQINLAAFCAVIVGGILAFLWFNIPPARYYMTETGSMALTMALAVVVLMTDRLGDGYGILVFPVIALPLLATTASVIIQILSKKFRNGKKVFLVAPLHHHFEALGWPAYKVTMRYWIIGVICALLGMSLALVG